MPDSRQQRAALQLLKDCQLAGLTHLPQPDPERLRKLTQPATAAEPPISETITATDPDTQTTPSEVTSPEVETPQPEQVAVSALTTPAEDDRGPQATRAERLALLSDRVAACTRCQELAQTRTQTVFGVGNPDAKVMFIGEAPGADEDRLGEPFVGKAGQLLDKIIDACGWRREELYICNILRCRPPGNRNPTSEEADHCREYLNGQIAIVNPDYIVCWGGVASNNLLGVDSPIGKMRGRLHAYQQAKVLCTYHPSYLLRNPSAKKQVWEDLKFLLNEMGLTPKAG